MTKTLFARLLPVLLAVVLMAGSGAGILEGLNEEDNNFFVSADPRYGKLAARVRENARKNSFNGSVLIATDDEIILHGGPRAVTTEGRPADPYTVYEIGSISKTFTAVVVIKLIERGRLRMDDRLTRFFPDFENGKDITIAHLLHMQSGLADYVNDPVTFFGRVYLIASTSRDAGRYGLDTVTQATLSELRK